MEFEIASSVLAEMASWVARAVPSRPTVPILAGIALQCADDHLVIEASDPDRSLRSRSSCTLLEEGRVVVAGRLLSDVVRALPAATVHCRSTDTELVLECAGLEYRFIRLPEGEYPDWEAIAEPAGSIAGDALRTAVARVIPAAGRDDLLPVFTAVQVCVDHNQLTLAATDRYRMATTGVHWSPSGDHVPATDLLVPARLLAEVCRTGGSPDPYEVGWCRDSGRDHEHIGFRYVIGEETREVRGRLLAGRIPATGRLVDRPAQLTLWVRTDELRAAVRRVRLTAEQRTPIEICLEEPGRMVISGSSAGRASGKAVVEPVAVEISAEDAHRLAFNPQYLLDALGTFSTEYLQLRIDNQTLTAILHGATDRCEPTADDHSHVVKMMHLPH